MPNKKLKLYKIPVVYQMWGILLISAETLDEAKKQVFEPTTHLPFNAEYIDDSIEIDEEGIELYNPKNKEG